MATASKDMELDLFLEDLLQGFSAKVRAMGHEERVRLSIDLLVLRYYLMARSMEDVLTSEELEEILKYLEDEIGKLTEMDDEVEDYEMVL